MKENAYKSQQTIVTAAERISVKLLESKEQAKAVEQIQTFTEDILQIASQTKMLTQTSSANSKHIKEVSKSAEQLSIQMEHTVDLSLNSKQQAGHLIDVLLTHYLY